MRQPIQSRQREKVAEATAAQERLHVPRLVFVILALAVLAGMSAARAMALDSENIRTAKALSNAYAEVVEHVAPAVVGIETEKVIKRSEGGMGGIGGMPDNPMDFFERFFDMPPGMGMPRGMPGPRRMPERAPDEDTRSTGIGSGVIIDSEGHILTNNHVVADADNIKVELAHEKGKTFKAEIVGRDPNSDLAVIKLTELPSSLPVADLGDSDLLTPGNIVLAIGSPLGFKQSVTAGIISAKERNLGELAYERFIQTDASINPGNSGGPLVNLDGEVVGLNTMISTRGGSGSIGIGFAIPINQAKGVITQLIEKGSVTRGWLGIVMNPEDEEISRQLGHDGTGVLITEVDPAGPASKAGIRRGDLVVSFDDTAIRDNEHLRYLVADTAPGRDVPIVVLRDGEKVNLTLSVEAQPEDLYSGARRLGKGGNGGGDLEGSEEVASSLGMSVRNLDAAAREKYGIAESVEQGVVVTEVDSTGEARNAGIRPGTVIIEMNSVPVKFRRILKDSAGRDKILVYLRYGDISRYMSLKLN